MYYCEKCRVKNEWPNAFVRSSGKCECCGESAVCWDRPSSSLPRVERKAPVTENNVAAQAGDEPMRAVVALAWKWNDEAIADGFAASEPAQELFELLGWPDRAAQVSPRATADVEREGGALHHALIRCCKELPEGYLVRVEVERGAGWVEWFGPENITTGNVIDGEGHLSDDVVQALAAIATTNPGA